MPSHLGSPPALQPEQKAASSEHSLFPLVCGRVGTARCLHKHRLTTCLHKRRLTTCLYKRRLTTYLLSRLSKQEPHKCWGAGDGGVKTRDTLGYMFQVSGMLGNELYLLPVILSRAPSQTVPGQSPQVGAADCTCTPRAPQDDTWIPTPEQGRGLQAGRGVSVHTHSSGHQSPGRVRGLPSKACTLAWWPEGCGVGRWSGAGAGGRPRGWGCLGRWDWPYPRG